MELSGFDFIQNSAETSSAVAIQLEKVAIMKSMKKKKRINRIGAGRDLDLDYSVPENEKGDSKVNIVLHENMENVETSHYLPEEASNVLQLSPDLENESDSTAGETKIAAEYDAVEKERVTSDGQLEADHDLRVREHAVQKSASIDDELTVDVIVAVEHDTTSNEKPTTERFDSIENEISVDVTTIPIPDKNEYSPAASYDDISMNSANSNKISDENVGVYSSLDNKRNEDNEKLIMDVRLEIEMTENIIKQLQSIVISKNVLLQRLLTTQDKTKHSDS